MPEDISINPVYYSYAVGSKLC